MGAGASAAASSSDRELRFADLPAGLVAGDHIAIATTLAVIPVIHHGIYVGGDYCVQYHWTPREPRGQRALVRLSPLAEFGADDGSQLAADDVVRVVGYPAGAADAAEQVVSRALSLVGQGGYNPLWRNCENFARFCKTGHGDSRQITDRLRNAQLQLESRAHRLASGGRVLVYEGGETPHVAPFAPPVQVHKAVLAGAVTGATKVVTAALSTVQRRAEQSDNVWRAELRQQPVAAATPAAHSAGMRQLDGGSDHGAVFLPWGGQGWRQVD